MDTAGRCKNIEMQRGHPYAIFESDLLSQVGFFIVKIEDMYANYFTL